MDNIKKWHGEDLKKEVEKFCSENVGEIVVESEKLFREHMKNRENKGNGKNDDTNKK